MKITVFSYVFKPEFFLVNELCEELSKKHSVTVYTGLPNYPQGEFFKGYSLSGPYNENFENIRVIRYPITPRKKGFFKLALNYFTHILFALLNLFRVPSSDVYFVFATSPLLIAIPAIILKKIRPRPLVIWYQDLWPESFVAVTKASPNSFFVKGLRAITKWVYKHTDVMLIQSKSFESNLLEYSYKGKIIYTPNWGPDFKPTNTSSDWIQKYRQHQCLISFAGNIGAAQNLKTLLLAASSLKDLDIAFLIVGDGREKEALEIQAQELGHHNIYFPGKKDLQEMPALFNASDFLYLSLAKDELFSKTIPAKLQAYMSLGKAVIAAIDGEGSRIIHEAMAGFSSPAEDVEALAAAIRKAYALDPSAKKLMGENAKAYSIKNFDRKLIIDRIEEALNKAVSSI